MNPNKSKRIKRIVSKGSLGAIIKDIRELRGMTMQETGIKAGFKPSTADVRIAQYEANQQSPRNDALESLANALDVNVDSLIETDLTANNKMYHALFMMRQLHGLHPVRIDGSYYLSFNNESPSAKENKLFLSKWHKKYEETRPVPEKDTLKEIEEKEKALKIWEYEYPQNKEERSSDIDYKKEAEALREKVDYMYADSHRAEELEKLDAAIQPFREKNNSELHTGELFTFDINAAILDVMESGVMATQTTYSHITDARILMVAFKTSDILKNTDTIEKYYKFYHIIDSMKKNLQPMTDIISKDEELYVAFWMNTDSSKKKEIANDICYIGEMQQLVNQKGKLSDVEYSRKRQDLIDTFYISNISI